MELISCHTRQQAIDDGVLFNVGDMAKEAGFKCPVAVTANLLHTWIMPTDKARGYGQDFQGRLWDVLHMLRIAIKRQIEPDRFIKFDVLFHNGPDARDHHAVTLWAISDAGDNGKPVITIMLPEDY